MEPNFALSRLEIEFELLKRKQESIKKEIQSLEYQTEGATEKLNEIEFYLKQIKEAIELLQ